MFIGNRCSHAHIIGGSPGQMRFKIQNGGKFKRTIVHPGIDVHFDIVFLNDHCGIVLHDGVFKLFVNVDR